MKDGTCTIAQHQHLSNIEYGAHHASAETNIGIKAERTERKE